MFWEKADFDDSDTLAAFRKRQKDKMKLRKKVKYELESYYKMFDLRRESVRVLKILQMCYQRECHKRSLNTVDEKLFDLQFDQLLRERGIYSGARPAPITKSDLDKAQPKSATK